MSSALFERFGSSATMMDAEKELIAKGPSAIRILASLLSGEAKNQFGIPYRQLGLPLRCALEVVIRLGPVARALEPLVREELRRGDFVAAQALGTFGTVEDESIVELAACLDYKANEARGFARSLDLAGESAMSILRLGHETHPEVQKMLAGFERAARDFAKTKLFRERQSKGKSRDA